MAESSIFSQAKIWLGNYQGVRGRLVNYDKCKLISQPDLKSLWVVEGHSRKVELSYGRDSPVDR